MSSGDRLLGIGSETESSQYAWDSAVTTVALPCQIHLPSIRAFLTIERESSVVSSMVESSGLLEGELPHRKLRTDLHVMKLIIHKAMKLSEIVIVEIGPLEKKGHEHLFQLT
jgi:hypothetical protein